MGAADDLRCEFHLTPRGWVGKREYFGKAQGAARPTPADTVATYELHIKQSHPVADERRSWTEIWRKGDASENAIRTLLKKWARPNEDTKLPSE